MEGGGKGRKERKDKKERRRGHTMTVAGPHVFFLTDHHYFLKVTLLTSFVFWDLLALAKVPPVASELGYSIIVIPFLATSSTHIHSRHPHSCDKPLHRHTS